MIREAIELLMAKGAHAVRKPEWVPLPNNLGWSMVNPLGTVAELQKLRAYDVQVDAPSEFVAAWAFYGSEEIESPSLWVSENKWEIVGSHMACNESIGFIPIKTKGWQCLQHWSTGKVMLPPDEFIEVLQDDLAVSPQLIDAVRRIKWRTETEGAQVTENANRYVSKAVRLQAMIGDDSKTASLLNDLHEIGGSCFENLPSPFSVKARLKLDLNKQVLSLKAQPSVLRDVANIRLQVAAKEVVEAFKARWPDDLTNHLELIFGSR